MGQGKPAAERGGAREGDLIGLLISLKEALIASVPGRIRKYRYIHSVLYWNRLDGDKLIWKLLRGTKNTAWDRDTSETRERQHSL